MFAIFWKILFFRMRVQYVYCHDQHLYSAKSVLDELEKRGHKIILKNLARKDLKNGIHLERSDCTITSYSILVNEFKGDCGKKICIEHGINPLRSVFPLNNHSYSKFDWILVSGKWWVNRAEDVKEKCVVTGYPKSDELISMRDHRSEILKEIEKKMKSPFIEGYPIISWVPSHSAAWVRTPDIVSLNIPNLIIAPHELTYRKFRGWGYDKNYPWYIETPNVNDLLSISDVVLTDFSSSGFEALAIPDLPVIQILAPNGSTINVESRKRGSYLTAKKQEDMTIGRNIDDISELKKEIDIAVKNKESYFKDRRDFWKDQLLFNCGNAINNCVHFIENAV